MVIISRLLKTRLVSVAGCLGYDVLVHTLGRRTGFVFVSVAGCLGYDVLASCMKDLKAYREFQLLVV